jgi:GDP-D-mannose 3', 5'-epimerase
MKKILVLGAGGFIGTHLVTYLKSQGYYVIGADLKLPKFSTSDADEFVIADLTIPENVDRLVTEEIYEIYQLAADMGGAGYVFTKVHDADIMRSNVRINLNVIDAAVKNSVKRIFYSSSACVYPEYNQLDPANPVCTEHSVYPADPDSEYGWEKLFSERLFLTHARNYGLRVRIARFHNIFGPLGSWNDGREKAPAATCRKVAMSEYGDSVDVWGPGTQTRSFLYIDECLEGIARIMASDCEVPVNLGSTRSISINDLTQLVATLANKTVHINNIPGPIGVMGRVSDNTLIRNQLDWEPKDTLEYGLLQTYRWIQSELRKATDDF